MDDMRERPLPLSKLCTRDINGNFYDYLRSNKEGVIKSYLIAIITIIRNKNLFENLIFENLDNIMNGEYDFEEINRRVVELMGNGNFEEFFNGVHHVI